MLKDNHSYENGHGERMLVKGTTRDYPDFVWTLQGNWHRREDGRFIDYRKSPEGEWIHVPGEPSWRDLNLLTERKEDES